MATDQTGVAILDALRHIQQSQTQLLTSVETLMERVSAQESKATTAPQVPVVADGLDYDASHTISSSGAIHQSSKESKAPSVPAVSTPGSRTNLASRIILT